MDPESDQDAGTHATASATPHAVAGTHVNESPEVTLERLAASYLAGGPQKKSASNSGASTPAAASPSGALATQSTRFSFPFSSFSLHLPPTSSLPGSPQEQSSQGSTIQVQQQEPGQEEEQEQEEEQDQYQDGMGGKGSSLAPKPLAVKPTYKKREVLVVPRNAANEMRMLMDDKTRMRSGGNIYDKTAELQWMAKEQDRLAREARRRRPRKTKPPKPPAKPRFFKPKIIKPLPVWKPEPLRSVKPQTSRPGPRSVNSGLIPPVNREAPIESLSKQQEIHRERLAQLATRPMPLRDLKTLITTELEHEYTVLYELGTQLHRELLKLQLEEGVLINMLKQSSDGLLSNADLVRVRPYKAPSKRELKKMERARRRQAARDLLVLKRRALGLGGPLMDVDNRMEHGDAMDLDQGPDFMRLNESYSSRPIAPSQAFGESSNLGRPKATAPHAPVSLENISNPAIERGQRRVPHNRHPMTSSWMPIDVDMREPDYAPSRGHGRQDEEAAYNSSDYEEEEEGEDEEEEDEDEDGDVYEDDDEEDEDEDDDEDDDEDEDEDDEEEDGHHGGDDQEEAARMALQQMLSMYGTG